jgi:phage baseplate assembly protein gpV
MTEKQTETTMAGEEGQQSLLDMIRTAVEICMPDMRHYYRMTKKAKVVATYASDGKYYCDVQPLRNDETEDDREPVVPKVEIPILWAGPRRGVVCPPVVGTYCDLSYYDGDPHYPRVSNFRWHGMDAPEAELNEFVIQLEPGVEIRIDKQKHVVTLTPENVRTEAGKDILATAGKNWTIQAGEKATVHAPQINLEGNLTITGTDGGAAAIQEVGDKDHRGEYALTGGMSISGNLTVGGTVTAPLFDGPATGLV